MEKKYKHLSSEERDIMTILRAKGNSYREIGRILKRNVGTISREFKRNRSAIYDVYLPHKAQIRADERNRLNHQKQRLKNCAIQKYVIRKLLLGWSPEQIAGRITIEYPQYTISYEAIYQYVYDKEVRKETDLVQCLARSHRKRYPRGHSRKHTKSHIPNRISIDLRPQYINNRKQFGHWEVDTAVSRKSTASLCISTERKTRLMKISKLIRKGARELSVALNRRLCHYPRYVRQTFTYDNGSENVEHERVNKVLNARSFFCVPYHSWEKGTVENSIGLIRRYLPKKTDFAKIPEKSVKTIEYRLNNRPRKCLNFKTPFEAFKFECCT